MHLWFLSDIACIAGPRAIVPEPVSLLGLAVRYG